MSLTPGQPRRLQPSTTTGTEQDRQAALAARAELDEVMTLVQRRCRSLTSAVGDLRRLDRDGWLDVAVHNLSLREEELDGALARLTDALTTAARLSAAGSTERPTAARRPSPLLLARPPRPLALVDPSAPSPADGA